MRSPVISICSMPDTAAALAALTTVPVRLREGVVRGARQDGVIAFKGLPYAAPPVGPLRFRSPQPVAPWSGERAALSFADVAVQPPDAGLFAGDPHAMPACAMSEDCLCLNVWAPDAPGPHPVLVWLHGGGQILGGTARPVYDGAAFARQGIVCVTVGFRLGLFGYLALDEVLGEAYADSGNAALLDQIAALIWVRDQIAAFGGDPARVTLGGESAGAKNVAALMASPVAAPLFSRVIMQSGGGETAHSLNDAHEVAERFLRFSTLTPEALLTAPADALLALQTAFLAQGGRRFPFRPTFGTAVLPALPVEGLNPGTGKPLLISTARDEIGPLVSDADLEGPWREDQLSHDSAEAMDAQTREALAAAPLDPRATIKRRLLVEAEYAGPTRRFAEANRRAGGTSTLFCFDTPIDHGPLAGTVPHTADLAPLWGERGYYSDAAALPDLHGRAVAFIRAVD